MRERFGISSTNNSDKVSDDAEREESFSLTPDDQENSSSSKMDQRKEKSLWLLSQNFVKMFLCSDSANSNNTSSTQSGQKKKCYLIDCSKPGQKVAEGRVWSSNPTDTVHLKPLGPNASKVSVDVPLVGNAKVWKPSSEIQKFRPLMMH